MDTDRLHHFIDANRPELLLPFHLRATATPLAAAPTEMEDIPESLELLTVQLRAGELQTAVTQSHSA